MKNQSIVDWLRSTCHFAQQQTFDFYKPKEYRPSVGHQDLQTQEEQLEEKREEFEQEEDDFPEDYPHDYVFHGTTKESLPSIFEVGLVPSTGKFVSEYYNDEGVEFEELVYMANREDIERALNAMVFQVGKLKGYDWPFNKVTPQDVIQHGALVLISPTDAYQAQEDQMSTGIVDDEVTETPTGAETYDIWSRGGQSAESVITGPQLLQVLLERGGSLVSSLKRSNPKAWAKIKIAKRLS